jgi:hypothetical protein
MSPFTNLSLRYAKNPGQGIFRYCRLWLYGDMLKRGAPFQDAAQELNLSPVAPEPAHVDCLEVIKTAHAAGHFLPFNLTTPAGAVSGITHHLFQFGSHQVKRINSQNHTPQMHS